MNEEKRRKRGHKNDASESSSCDEAKSRKSERKNSESQQIAKKERKKRSRDEKQNTSCSTWSSDSGSEESPCGDLETKKKKRKHARKDKMKRRGKEKRKRKQKRKEKKSKRHKEKEGKRTAGEIKEKHASKDIQATDTLMNKSVLRDPGSDTAPKKRSMAPMTKEEYEKQQAQVRRVYDPETGRHRLVKGTGEILEEIVSRDRHKAINKTATQGDGAFFQANLGLKDR